MAFLLRTELSWPAGARTIILAQQEETCQQLLQRKEALWTCQQFLEQAWIAHHRSGVMPSLLTDRKTTECKQFFLGRTVMSD